MGNGGFNKDKMIFLCICSLRRKVIVVFIRIRRFVSIFALLEER